ncbi:AAA ATPase [Tulasnella sp. 403]|nr:AAA ATPase [Tulasnella sp. 403]
MVLGKRSRQSLSSSHASATITPTPSNPTASTPGSPICGSPAPSLKRARTRSSSCLADDRNNKENVAPVNWYVCGRSVDQQPNRQDNAEDELDDDDELSTVVDEPVGLPARVSRNNSRARPQAPRRTSSASTRRIQTTASTSATNLPLDTPPSTPTHERFLSASYGSETDDQPISSLYLSGSPGTGKTALVTDILAQLQRRELDITPVTTYVNCMGLADVNAVWDRVWETLVQSLGGSASSKLRSGDAKRFLEDALKGDQEFRCVLVLDELDFISRSPAALSEVYQLAQKHAQTLRLIGISNTLTLGSDSSPVVPSTPTKIRRSKPATSLAGPQKSLNFPAYTSNDLLEIINSRLAPLETQERNELFHPAALSFLSKKVAASNGDVRYALSVLRRCIDSVEKETSDPSKRGRVEMRHVLESLRAHESGTSGSGPRGDGTGPAGSDGKGSGASRTVRGLGLHARLALVALLVGWRRLEAGLPLVASKSSNTVPEKLTATALYTFYVTLLSATIIDEHGDAGPASPFNPVSRGEFQDILGVLETSGLIAFTNNAPTGTSLSGSISAPSLATTPLTPPKTPKKPRGSTRSASFQSFSLSTPSRSTSASGGGRKASAGELCVSLSEGVREEEVVRGLTSATTASSEKNGVVEREIQRLWDGENRRTKKDVEKRERKLAEAAKRDAMEALAFTD